MQVIRDRTEGETRGRGQWSRVVEFVTPEEGCLFSYCVGTAMYVLRMLRRVGVSPGLKHGLAGEGVCLGGSGVVPYWRVPQVHSRKVRVG